MFEQYGICGGTFLLLFGIFLVTVFFILPIVMIFWKLPPENHPTYEAAKKHEHQPLAIHYSWVDFVNGGYQMTHAECYKCEAHFVVRFCFLRKIIPRKTNAGIIPPIVHPLFWKEKIKNQFRKRVQVTFSTYIMELPCKI